VFKPREPLVTVLCLPVSRFMQTPQGLTKKKPKRQITTQCCGSIAFFAECTGTYGTSFPSYLCSLSLKRDKLRRRKVNISVLSELEKSRPSFRKGFEGVVDEKM